MKKKLIFSILGVLVISACAFGITYAYYNSSNSATIDGEAGAGLNTTLALDTIYNSTRLVPLDDSLVKTAITKNTNKCIDKSGYEVCTLYKVTLSNTVNNESLYGYVKTEQSTYTTENLKYQIFSSNYTELTDVLTLSQIAEETIYFEKNSELTPITSSGTTTYYLAIWLHDTGENQKEDYSKNFSGYIGFESVDYHGTSDEKLEILEEHFSS